MKKIILEFFTITITIFFLFKYNIEIKSNLENIMFIFFKNIIPSLFPLIFISNYIKYFIINNIRSKNIKFLFLSLCFVPSNAFITNSNNELIYSSNINPLFSYIIFKNIIGLKYSLIIITINLLINYYFLYKNISIKKINIENKSISDIISITTFSLINILGIIIFFNILISILSIIIPNKILFFLEITNGYQLIKDINIFPLKILLFSFLNSFGGIAMMFQIKSINNTITGKNLNKKIINSFIISIITTIIILLI